MDMHAPSVPIFDYRPWNLDATDPRVAVVNNGLRYSNIFVEKEHPFYVPMLEGYGTKWLNDTESRALIIHISRIYVKDGQEKHLRRIGPRISEISHALWVMNAMFNSENIQKAAKIAGIEPVIAAILGGGHDVPELIIDILLRNVPKQDRAEVLATQFPSAREDALTGILQLCPSEMSHLVIRAVDLDYMTDDNPSATGKERIDLQAAKPITPKLFYGPRLDALIKVCNLELRAYDKAYNLFSDAYWREQYVIAFNEGKIPAGASIDEKRSFGLPDEDLEEAVTQAKMKQFAMRDGVPQWLRDRYTEKLEYLESELTRIGARPSIEKTGSALTERKSGTPKSPECSMSGKPSSLLPRLAAE